MEGNLHGRCDRRKKGLTAKKNVESSFWTSGGVSVKNQNFWKFWNYWSFYEKIGQTAGSAGLAGHNIGCSIKFETSFIIIIWFFNACMSLKKKVKKKKSQKKKESFLLRILVSSVAWHKKNSPWQKNIFFLLRPCSFQSTSTCRELQGEQIHIWYAIDPRPPKD